MGHFVYEDELDRIDFEDGEWVDIKRRMSCGDDDTIEAHFLKARMNIKDVQKKDVDVNIDLDTGKILLLALNIKAWSFKDRDDKLMPINKTTIAMLDRNTKVKLLNEIDKRNPLPKV